VVSRGALLRLREQVDLTERGKELLKLKRDHLAAETNRLLSKVNSRKVFEQRLMETYNVIKDAYVSLGYSGLQSEAFTTTGLKVKTLTRSVIGVTVPEIALEQEARVNSVVDASAYTAANKLSPLIKELLSIAEAEARIERIAQELMLTSRRVNALEKAVLPEMHRAMRYIEAKLDDETLEEFFRAKRVKAAIGGHTH